MGHPGHFAEQQDVSLLSFVFLFSTRWLRVQSANVPPGCFIVPRHWPGCSCIALETL